MVSTYDVHLDKESSDTEVQRALTDFVAENEGSLGNFTIASPTSGCCTCDVAKLKM